MLFLTLDNSSTIKYDCKQVLQRCRGGDDIEEEFEAIRMTCLEAERQAKAGGVGRGAGAGRPTVCHMLLRPSVQRALLLGCALQTIQQLAGIRAVT